MRKGSCSAVMVFHWIDCFQMKNGEHFALTDNTNSIHNTIYIRAHSTLQKNADSGTTWCRTQIGYLVKWDSDVYPQRDDRQWSDVTSSIVTGLHSLFRLPARHMRHEYIWACNVTALFGIFLEADKHHILKRLKHPVVTGQQSLPEQPHSPDEMRSHSMWWCLCVARLPQPTTH